MCGSKHCSRKETIEMHAGGLRQNITGAAGAARSQRHLERPAGKKSVPAL